MIAVYRMLVVVSGLVFSSISFGAEVEAKLQWYQKVLLTTPVSGVIVAVNADVGDSVKKAQPLLQLDDRLRKAQVNACKSELKAAQNSLNEAERELERTQDMYDQTLLADHDLQVAVIARDAADADLQKVQVKLVKATLALEYSTIRAPFDGRVVRRQANAGQAVNHDLQLAPLLELAEANHMVARIQASGQLLSSLVLGTEARVVVGGASFSGRVIRAGLEPVPGWEGNYSIDVVFETDGQLFYVGQTAKVVY